MTAYEKTMSSTKFHTGAKLLGKTVEAMDIDKKKSKALGGVFKSLKRAAGSMGLSILVYALDQMQVFVPFFKVLGSLLKFFGGKILVALMPVIEKFIKIFTSEEFLEILEALAELIAAFLLPILDIWLDIMIELLPIMYEFVPIIKEFTVAMKENPEIIQTVVLGLVAFRWAIIATKESVGPLVSGILAAKKAIDDLVEALESIKNPLEGLITSSGGEGGGDSGSGGIVGAIEDLVYGEKQLGTDYIQATGLYKLEKGEKIENRGDAGTQATQMENLLMTQEQILDIQKQLLHHMRYGT